MAGRIRGSRWVSDSRHRPWDRAGCGRRRVQTQGFPDSSGHADDRITGNEKRRCGLPFAVALSSILKDGRALGPASSPSVIVSATLQELQDKTSRAVTAGGTLLPMSDVIRIATHAYHYLALFDGATGQALWLGRTKRLATGDQRIVLHAAASSSSDSPVDP